jgi:glycosyltransferase involved in cell wall biosynthesis
MTKQKKKILVIADSPLAPSGVGTQTKYMIEAMLKTGEYKFLCLAGAMAHQNYSPQAVDPWGKDWVIKPVDGYGDQNTIRAILRDYKPDVLWFMTDPRFYVWLWSMENEIRENVPMVYYHVWDNYPYPRYNKQFYDSNDTICTISKVTDDIVRNVSPAVDCVRIPHTVDTDIFRKSTSESISNTRNMIIGQDDKLIFFWNNRNARRKQSGTLIFWFKEFLDKVGHDKACLVMHTEPKDPHGQDLEAIMKELGLDNRQIILSTTKVSPHELAKVYSAADCTINISDAEGFGLGTLESLSCETPIIVNMTGGLQEQVTDGQAWFGFGIEPSSKSIIGSQDVPYIYEDRMNKEEFIEVMVKFYEMSKQDRESMGASGREHVLKNYGFKQYSELWKSTFDTIIEKFGSWENRKNYKNWEIREIL